MKINKFSWENQLLFKFIKNTSIYDAVYAVNLNEFKNFGFNFVVVAIDSKTDSNFSIYESLKILYLLAGQKPVFSKIVGRFKIKKLLVTVILKNKILINFYYYYLSTIFYFLKKKQIKFSQKFDQHNNLNQILLELNPYLKLGTKNKIFEWNKPIQIHFNLKSEKQQVAVYCFSLFYFFLQWYFFFPRIAQKKCHFMPLCKEFTG